MFWLLFIGQGITSATYLMENNGCSKLSALWFPPHERTIATSLYSIIASQVSERVRGIASLYISYSLVWQERGGGQK